MDRCMSNKRRAVGLLASSLIALVVGEWASRVVFHKNVEQLRFSGSDRYYYYDREGYRRHIPKSVGYERMWNDQGKAEFRINSFGFRGPELSERKAPGTVRIVFLGDSITLGGRLPEEATFVSRVGKALNSGGSSRYEIVNAGAGDVGLAEEEETLKGQVFRLQPDAVVLCWYLNDARPPVGFPEEVVYNHWFIRWINVHPIFRRSYLVGAVYDGVRKSLVARQMVYDRRFDWIEPYKTGAWATDVGAFVSVVHSARFDWGDAWSDASLSRMAEKLKGLRDASEARGIRFLVVAMPLQAQVYARFSSPLTTKPQDEMGTFARKNSIKMLDLLPVLKKRAGELLFYDQCHYTPRGNEIVAKAISDFLRREEVE